MAGLSRAMEKDASVGDRNIIVIMTDRLKTDDAAKIFLNINTEQRPVPPLVLYMTFLERLTRMIKIFPLLGLKILHQNYKIIRCHLIKV